VSITTEQQAEVKGLRRSVACAEMQRFRKRLESITTQYGDTFSASEWERVANASVEIDELVKSLAKKEEK